MAEDEYEYEYGEEEEEEFVDLDAITDEKTLIDMLDQAEDFDERKKIRDRLKIVQYERRAEQAQRMKRREEDKDLAIKKRFQEAEDKKKRTLAMYDDMAKSSPAGGKKVMDLNIYKYNDASSGRQSPAAGEPKRDLVEEAIRERFKSSEDRKKRILAAYDYAAKTQPCGREKIVDFQAFRNADVSDFTQPKPVGSCTFGMSGGVPKVVKGAGSTPGTPVISPRPGNEPPRFPNPEEDLDPMEKAIRARQREADERKRRTLAAYDIIAKSGVGGPKVVVLEEFRDLKVSPDMKFGSTSSSTSGFRGGVPQTAGGSR